MLALANKLTNSTQPIYRFVNKYSIDFDGVDDRIVTDGADSVAQNSTYSFWCKSSTTGENRGVFGHGSHYMGGFHFNYDAIRPLLYLGSSKYVFWADTPAQDDGEWHHWVVYADFDDISNAKLYVDGVLQTTSQVVTGATTAYTESLTIGSDKQVGGHSFSGKIDEFAVYDRELTQDEITRMFNTYYSPNRVANGNFSQIGNEEVTNGNFSQIGNEEITNGDFSQEGSEEVTNGDFATDSAWNKGTGWTISGGKANVSSGTDGAALSQDICKVGVVNKVVFTISNYTGSGYVRLRTGNASQIQDFSANGTYTFYVTPTTVTFGFDRYITGSLSIDNVSVKEVGQNWTRLGTNATNTINFEANGVRFISVDQNISISQFSVLEVGKFYKLTCDVVTTTGAIGVDGAITEEGTINMTNGFNEIYFTASSDTFKIKRVIAVTNCLLSNVSVKEVGQDWSFGTGWSMGDGKALNTGGANFSDLTQNNTNITIGKNYEITYTVSNFVSGSFKFIMNNNSASGLERNADGTYTDYISALSQGYSFRTQGSGFTGSVDNVSVKEVLQGWSITGSGVASIVDGALNYSNTVNGSWFAQFISQAVSFVQNKIYKVTFKAKNISGAVNLRITHQSHIVFNDNLTSSFVDYTVSYTAQANDDSIRIFCNDAIGEFQIDNIVVQELKHDATNLMLNAGAYQSANPLITSTKSMEFDGTDDYLQLSEPFSYTNHTITGWFKFTNETTDRLVFEARDASNDGIAIYIAPDEKINYLVNNFSINSGSVLPTDKWINLTFTYNGATLKIYLDGVLANSGNAARVISTTTNAKIGANVTNAAVYKGKITEFGTYNRCLTALEVASLYNQGMPTNLLVNRNNYQSGNPTVFNTKQVDFDGTDDYMDLGTQSATSSLTYSAWVYYEGSSGSRTILALGQTLFRIGNATTINLWSDVNQTDTSVTITDIANRWSHIVVTQTGTTVNVYQDGVLKGTNSSATSVQTSAAASFIGKFSSTWFFNGKISQIGVWNEALTADEVSSLYNHGLPIDLTTNQAAYQSSSNLVGYWRMGSGLYDNYPSIGQLTNGIIADQTNATLGNELIVNGDFSQIGSEQVTNGDFSNGLNDFVSEGVVLEDGGIRMESDGSSGSYIKQAGILTLNKTYKLVFEVKQVQQTGSLRVGFTNLGQSSITSIGKYTIYFVANGNEFQFVRNSAINVIIDNVSVKEVGQNWTFGAGWGMTDGKASRDGSGSSNSDIQQSVSVTAGKVYKISYDRTYISGGGESNLYSDFITDGSNQTLGSYSDTTQETVTITSYFSPNYTGTLPVRVWGIGTFTGTVDNVSLKEFVGNPAIMTNMISNDIENGSPYANIVQNGTFDTDTDWTLATGWTISGGKANANSPEGTTAMSQVVNQFTAGKFYKVSFEVTEITSGYFRIYVYSGSSGTFTNLITTPELQTGTYEAIFEFGGTDKTFRIYGASNTASALTIGSVDNVTVEEVNTGLQGYWKMGDGTNDEYPVIYDQVDPTLGSELVTNGDFATDSDWTKGTGWTISGGSANCDGTQSGNSTIVTSSSISGIQNKVVKFSFELSNCNSGSISATVQGTGGQEFSSLSENKMYVIYIVSVDTSALITFTANSDFIGSIDNVSIKEVQGNPATMTNMVEGNITNQFPLTKIRNYYRMGDGILDGYPIIQDQTSPNLAHIPTTNMLVESEDFTSGIYTRTRCTITSNQAIAPNGTQTADLMTATGDDARLEEQVGSSGAEYTQSVYVKSAQVSDVDCQIDFAGLNTVTFTANQEWQRVQTTLKDTAYSPRFRLRILNDTNSVYVWGAQLEQQSQATPYLKSEGIAAVRKSTTTNLINYSEDFTKSFWTPTRCTITSNQITSPNGTLDADLLTATNTSENYIQTSNTVAVSGTSQTVSFYVKKGTSDFAHILLWDNSSNGARQWFDLTNGTIGTSTSFGSGITVNNANMISYSNDWYRCIVVFSNSTANIKTRISASNSNGSTTSTVGKTIYIWGSQLEVQTQAENYAKTTGLPVTINLFTENNYGTMTNMSASDIVEDTPNN